MLKTHRIWYQRIIGYNHKGDHIYGELQKSHLFTFSRAIELLHIAEKDFILARHWIMKN